MKTLHFGSETRMKIEDVRDLPRSGDIVVGSYSKSRIREKEEQEAALRGDVNNSLIIVIVENRYSSQFALDHSRPLITLYLAVQEQSADLRNCFSERSPREPIPVNQLEFLFRKNKRTKMVTIHDMAETRCSSIAFNESSSSEDDEILEALKEATDSQFLNASLFHKNIGNGNVNRTKRKEESTELPKTLRRTNEYLEIPNEFGVTQDFKNFVAKELAKSLDKYLKEEEEEVHCTNGEPNESKRGANSSSIGIKLMRDSKEFISTLEGNDEAVSVSGHNKKHKREFNNRDNFLERSFKCKQVAVEPDWVLSKVSASMWTERPKGAIYKYKKLDNGDLIEIN